MLVRCAVIKYVESGHEKSLSLAVKQFVQRDLLKFVRTVSLHKFRKEFLWNQKINLVLEANARALRRVYESFVDLKKKVVTYKRITRRLLVR
jgi:hypothetical protein